MTIPINRKEQLVLNEITKLVGSFPTKIDPNTLEPKEWDCSKCGKEFRPATKSPPGPCINCGSIFF